MTAQPKRNSTAEWQAQDRQHLHPFTDQRRAAAASVRRSSPGPKVPICSIPTATRCLDAFAGLWCVNIGYGRKSIADVAHAQLLELPYYNTFFKTTHPPVAELSKLLVEMTPKQFNHVFYGLSGSDANDTIVRMVRTYWNLKKQPTKKTIISRWNGYHGSTMVAASLGGMNYMHELADLPLPGHAHIKQPYWYGEGGAQTPGGIRPRGRQGAGGQDPRARRRERARPSSASRSRVRAASSSRPRPIGRRSRGSARSTTCC